MRAGVNNSYSHLSTIISHFTLVPKKEDFEAKNWNLLRADRS